MSSESTSPPESTSPTAYLVAEDDPYRLYQQNLHRNAGRTAVHGLAQHGSYDTLEGGLAGASSGPNEFSEMFEDSWTEAYRRPRKPIARLKGGKVGRETDRRIREQTEAPYITYASQILSVADDPKVPDAVKDMVRDLDPKLWRDRQRHNKGLSFKQSYELVRNYRRSVEAQRVGVMEKLPDWSAEALATLRHLSANETAIAAATQRLQHSQVHFVPPIEYYVKRPSLQSHNLSRYAGDFQPASGVARLVLNQASPDQYEGTAKHELLHVMSAHAPKMVSGPDGLQLRETRLGLSFTTKDPRTGEVKLRYDWLNELIVEATTRQSTNQPSEQYPWEIELAHDIAAKIGLGVLLDAALEPIKLGAPASQQTPYLKKMVKAFHDTFGPGSLRLMDLYINDHGGTQIGTQAFLQRYGRIMRNSPRELAASIRQDNPQYRKGRS